MHVLSLGGKFGLPFDNRSKYDKNKLVLEVLKSFESAGLRLSDDVINETRIRVSNCVHKFVNKKQRFNSVEQYIGRAFICCKQFLKENNDLMVTKADKGQVTVIMDRNHYIAQMRRMLEDETTYLRLNKDPSKWVANRIQDLVKGWLALGIIDDRTYGYLRTTNGNIPRCYGLPKVHKPGVPLRLIVSAVGSPIYSVVSFLHRVLADSISKPDSYVKDSWNFVSEIVGTTIEPHESMVSFDVVSLFTNVPSELVMRTIRNRWHLIEPTTKFSLDQFLHAINVILTSTSFAFDGQFFDQIFGSPMGSPLSPILADIVLDDLKMSCFPRFDFKIQIFKRYVDDIFTVIPTDRINDVLVAFNNYHPRLCFTVEMESNNSLNFLDTTIIRDNGTLIPNWYRKPTFSGRYVNFHASNPLQHKVSVVTGLVDRAVLLSDRRFHHTNIELVKSILLNNCYPREFVNRHIAIRLRRLRYWDVRDNDGEITVPNNNERKKGFIAIPYVKGISEQLRRIYMSCDLRVACTVFSKLDRLIKLGKDMLSRDKKTNVVYRIKCNACNACYVGQTKRHLSVRIGEHRSNIKKSEGDWSVVSRHRVDNDHDFDWAHVDILHQEKHLRKREVAEMILIKKHDNTINLQKDTDSLPGIYDQILINISVPP
ncbi:hypothetical protein DMN91_009388 [Ooceraea biroi]|uniref:Reverse transcriptase domain-containing protein n=1 Tax=Ooceraea biroi TaxID=2015173 RepID=A0A3L8DEX6_OOCBI|nr:uncharacterized protein LOC105282903 [Ooceraea biroi]RLU19030.1 hypothetical protein DMN91_009388 [Ooceraea biroi]